MPIDTATVTQRRKLRFNTLDELEREIDRIVAADEAGRLRRCGNWTAGQIFGHLATWIDYGYSGYPVKAPFFIRWLIRRKLPTYLRDGMPAGVKIPKVEGGTFGTEPLSAQEGAKRLKASLQRMRKEPAKFESPAFGKMSEDQRVALNLRHAELHLGFLLPD